MTDPRLSRAAAADLRAIGRNSAQSWGVARADAYLLALREAVRGLGRFPASGREAGDLRPGLRRVEHAEHVIFYRADADAILVLRILHRRMLPSRHL